MNAVVIAVLLVLVLSLARVNVIIALTVSALVAGLMGNMDLASTIDAFNAGLGGGATIALGYALLGAFAVALSHTGIPDSLSRAIVGRLGGNPDSSAVTGVKYSLLVAILLMAVASQNAVPIHIAFIPILIPPLLGVFNKLKLDRRLIACVITFGLVTTYMVLPVGFGGIFLKDILMANLVSNGLKMQASDLMGAMSIPALGMVFGLLTAIFFSYRKPREYADQELDGSAHVEHQPVSGQRIAIVVLAIASTLGIQLYTDSMIFGALAGFVVLNLGGMDKGISSHDVFTQGVRMMATVGFIMIAAAGFAEVIKATGEVPALVDSVRNLIGDNKAMAAFLMLLVGLFITMGIGSSFSTIPIIAAIYVPLAMGFGFSVAATIALVGTAAALGDAGSPASDSTLGPTAGLNADGQHDHIWDSVVPTFLHYNLPLLASGWVAAMVL
ncbi:MULTISPECIES: Na+/H+ antiporter family protein [Ferrimonas]|uniref:Na+/H+ antiporter family protein n=1 Tax=Ferrimonas TaxID=44011 RepID=UPI0003F9CF33|nr:MULTISPECIES: Na+/H+ antiporter family protein [Ferrimonas]USD39323.1 Na+/H+ antiporter family protein [Ferrimonas sp. SCSIO 43195]